MSVYIMAAIDIHNGSYDISVALPIERELTIPTTLAAKPRDVDDGTEL